MTIVMSPDLISCIGGTKYPHCILLYCIVLYCIHASVQFNQQSTWLLQFTTARSSRVDYEEAAESTEQHSSCGAGSKSSFQCQATSAAALLVASASTRAVPGGSIGAENPYDWCPGVPQRASGSTHRCSAHTLCFIASADCTKTNHWFLWAFSFLLGTCYLEQSPVKHSTL